MQQEQGQSGGKPAGSGWIRWVGGDDGRLELLDQTKLPSETVMLRLEDLEAVRAAIRRLSVRGAPAIGVAAAFGLWLGIRGAPSSPSDFATALEAAKGRLASARPTAANPVWALERVEAAMAGHASVADKKAAAFKAAVEILQDDIDTCQKMADVGVSLIRNGERILTYCNTGGLAAAGIGTALAVVFEARRRGLNIEVVSCETRPLLQGARLTMWELMQARVPATLICDNTAATVMKLKKVDRVLVGADRIARNGDFANKIGTYGVALLAKAHGIPFHVVAPRSTFDLSLESGNGIPIEEREASEITDIGGKAVAPAGARVFAPAFDVTPAELVTSIVTEAGMISPVNESAVVNVVRRQPE
jgi:methylthioribose-1-phosphate isomerase